MKIIKILLTSLFSLVTVIAIVFYLYVQSLPTSPPQVVNAADLERSQRAPNLSCSRSGEFNYAYRVKVRVESLLNSQVIYRSNLTFKTQLSQANGSIVKGVATDIIINEGQGNHSIDDIYYLSRVEGRRYALFSAYNDLGLVKQHPMGMLSQLLKALSVGEEGESYLFTYDPMQRTYQYRHHSGQQGIKIERASHASTANRQQLKSLFNEYKNHWSVALGQDCMPESVVSEERQGIAAGEHGGHISFRVEAERISPYTSMAHDQHNELANAHQRWQVKQIGENEFENKVSSTEQMWEVFNEFSQSKNTGELIKAAEYLLENVPAYELAVNLSGSQTVEDAKRDLIFGLGISQHVDAENYLISVFNELPVGAGSTVDLQKIRLMVALSGNHLATETSYRYLEELLQRSDETVNVRSNALINMGAVITQLNNNGQSATHVIPSFEQHIREQLDTPSAASAIMAAGNARLTNLDDLYLQKLSSGNTKERYAASTVLSRDTQHYDRLIRHITAEKSNLVVNAIISSMNVSVLTASQRLALQSIAAQDSGDKQKIVQAFLEKQ